MKIKIPSLEEQKMIVERQNTKSYIHIDCRRLEKTELIEHARKKGMKLGEWCLNALISQMLQEKYDEHHQK